jgi:2',3'-cyclic-nucleotide 2'-phosphodiesterase/3'-nucleotidase
MKNLQIRLLVTSDIHGYVYPTAFRDTSPKNMGLAKLATIIHKEREKGPVVLIDNGDFIQGSPLTYYHHKFRNTVENPMVQIANRLNYDAVIFGNHEFNYGLSTLKQVIDQSQFPWLAANIKQEDGTHLGKPYMIKNIAGVRIAILGVTTHFIPNWEEPEHIQGLLFENALETVQKWVDHIRQHEVIDLLIVCYHGGFERDFHTGELAEMDTGENQGYAICQQLADVDIVVTGHQHREIATTLFGKSVVQPGTRGNCLAEVTITVSIDDSNHIVSISHEPTLLYPDQHTPADSETCQLIEKLQNETEQWLDQTLGVVEGDMIIEDAFQARLADNPYVEFINRVQLKATGAMISCAALFHNHSGGFPPHVTMRDIVSNYVYPNTLKVLLLSGHDILAALEQCAKYFAIEEGAIVVNPIFERPKLQHYNYDMWEGIEYELKISNPIGKRVTKLLYNGNPIELDQSYHVVMNSYRASGAGHFDMFKNKPVIKEIQTDMTELIANELIEKRSIPATCDHNWRVIL